MGENTKKLYQEVAKDENINPEYLFHRMLVDRAEDGLAALPMDKMKDRVGLIQESNREKRTAVAKASRRVKVDRHSYQVIWQWKKRLKERGYTDQQIHNMCIEKYGIDYETKPTPSKNPRLNPKWKGGGRWKLPWEM